MRTVEAQQRLAPDLLRLLAFLAPDDLPRWIIGKAAEQLPADLALLAADADALADLIAVPRAYSLVATHDDGVSLHRVLHAVVRRTFGRCCARVEWCSRAGDAEDVPNASLGHAPVEPGWTAAAACACRCRSRG